MPVGTGPYKVVEHQLGQGVVLEKFEDYYDPERPILDKITYIPIPEPEPLAAAIEAGDIQIIGGNAPAAELIDRFVANPDLTVSEVPGPGFQALWMNPWRDPFKVPDFDKPIEELKQEPGFMVRLAIAKAIDREDLINRALFGRGVPAFGTINPAMRYFFDTGINETSEQRFDLEEAQRLLAEAGFPNGEGFPTLKLLITPAGKREGEIIADILKKNLNIDVELDIKDWTVLVELNNTMDFDMLRIGSGGDYDPDDGLVDWMMTTSKFNGPDRAGRHGLWHALHRRGRRPDRTGARRDRPREAQGVGAKGQQAHLRQGGSGLPVPSDGHTRLPQRGELPGREPYSRSGRPGPDDHRTIGLRTACCKKAEPPPHTETALWGEALCCESQGNRTLL